MISAKDLAKKKFQGLQLHAPYDELVGVPEISMSCLISGFPGEGKSTLALQLAKELSEYGNVLYVAAEEGTGFTMQEKIRRLGLANSDIKFTDWEGFATLKKQIGKNHVNFVVLDSITAMDRYLRDFDDFRQWMKNNGRGLIVVSHSTKAGGYKGDSSLGHDVDTIIELQGGTARTTKNRYGILAEIPVNFGNSNSSRKNPDKKNEVRKGILAMKRVIKTHKDVAAAMSRPDIGPIDFIWGDKDHGIDHIIRRRDEEALIIPELKGQKGKDVVLRLPLVIARGIISQKQPGERVLITHQKYGVILSKNYEGHPQNWVLTGFRDYKRKNPDETDGFLSSAQSYTPKTYERSQSKVVAGSASNIQNSPKNKEKRKNPVRSFSDPLVYLGKTLKVTIDSDDGVRTLKGTGKENRFPMFASLNKHRLYIVPPEFVKRVSKKVHSHQAKSVYEQWNGYDADDVDYAIEWPKKGTKSVSVGWADHIWYESDKMMQHGDRKGKPHYYVHKFDSHKRPAAVMGNVLVISNLDIDERGILN